MPNVRLWAKWFHERLWGTRDGGGYELFTTGTTLSSRDDFHRKTPGTDRGHYNAPEKPKPQNWPWTNPGDQWPGNTVRTRGGGTDQPERRHVRDEGQPGLGQDGPATAAYLRWGRGPRPAEPSTARRLAPQARPGPASQTTRRVAKAAAAPPSRPVRPSPTSTAAADQAGVPAPRRAGPRRRSRPLGDSGASSASGAFVVSRTREPCVSESDTKEKRHPLSLKRLRNGEERARGRHLVTRMDASEPIGGKRAGEGEEPASSYCACASEPPPPAPPSAGRLGSRGACASPP